MRTTSIGRFFSVWAAVCAGLLSPVVSQAQNTARYNHTTTLLPNGNVLIVGGSSNTLANVQSPNDVEIFVTTRGVSIAGATLGAGLERSSHTATLLPNGLVLVAGGIGNGAVARSDTRLYNPATDSWSAGPAMSVARVNHTATLLPNGNVLLAGGENGGGVQQTCDLYNTSSNLMNSPAPCSSMLTPRSAHTAVLLYNGLVWVAGGENGIQGVTQTTELYDYNANSWRAAGALNEKRAFHSATVLGDRRVLVAGGFNGLNLLENQGILDTTEIYDPASDQSLYEGVMQTRKMGHAAVLQNDGTLALQGGFGNITTSYFQFSPAFEPGSALTVGGSLTNSTGTISIYPTSNLTLHVKQNLSVPLTGEIVKGQIFFADSRSQTSDGAAIVNFANNKNRPKPINPTDQQYVDLDGTYATCDANGQNCGKIDGIYSLKPASGTVYFPPQNYSANSDVTMTAGNATFAGSCSNTCSLTGGTLTGSVDIAVSKTFYPGNMIAGDATIFAGGSTAGTIAISSFVSVALTGGGDGGTFSGGALSQDVAGNVHYIQNITFSSLTGNITVNGGTISGAQALSGLKLTGLRLFAHNVFSHVDLSGANYTFSIGTVTIEQMVFGEQELYKPNTPRVFTFNPSHSYVDFNQTVVYMPTGDSLIFGGRVCAAGDCTNAIALTGPGAHVQKLAAWTIDAPMQSARGGHTSTELPDGRILTVGGVSGTTFLASAEIYDPTTRSWSPTGALNVARSGHAATLLPNGRVLVAGGFTSLASTGSTNSAEIYYPDSGQWVQTGVMVSSRQLHTASLLPNGNVLVAGGSANGAYLRSAEIYYSTAAAWRAAPNMLLAGGRADHSATLLYDGRVLVVGGINASGESLSVEAYDPVANSWANSPPANMPAGPGRAVNGRYAHSASLLRDGRVLIAGGSDGFGEVGLSLIYSPLSNAWTFVRNIAGSDMVARLRHTATLLPDGKVLVAGGSTAQGSSVNVVETFSVQLSTWTSQTAMATKRATHTTALLSTGNVLHIGGATSPGIHTLTTESQYFTGSPDAVTATPAPTYRKPNVAGVNPSQFDRGASVTLYGSNFKGMSEASGGGAGSGNSSFNAPRVYMESTDSRNGVLVDLSDQLQSVNQWTNADSSLTVAAVPVTLGGLPYGWYDMRVAANAQFSNSTRVQVAPRKPANAPGAPVGTFTSATSILWSWSPAPAGGGTIEGYNLYFDTNSLFISTAGCVGSCVFHQTQIPPNSVVALRVAAYNIAGDGPVAVATAALITQSSIINSVSGVGLDAASIRWSWSNVAAANSYSVYNATNNVLLSTVAVNSYTQTGLSTNTIHSIYVVATTLGGNSPLSPSATTYTLAAVPTISAQPLFNQAQSSFIAAWNANTNPPNTTYVLTVATGAPNGPGSSSVGTGTNRTVSGLNPNTPYFVTVAAQNGDGVQTNFVSLGSTYTLANPPLNPQLSNISYSSMDLSWGANGNPSNTAYQVVYSTDAFATTISTPVAFSANFTKTSVTFFNLLTGPLYTVRVTAQNQSAIPSSFAEVSTRTFNGNAPLGDFVFSVAANGASVAGTVGSGRTVSLQVPPGAFSTPVSITVSSQPSGTTTCANPTALDAAVSISLSPPLQPQKPIQIAISYNPNDVGLGPLGTLSMLRYDSVSGACVPLKTTIDSANLLARAQTNHFSIFELAQVPASNTIDTARIYPNPLYIKNQGYMTFDRLPAGATVRILTLHGETVFEDQANASGVMVWSALNKSSRAVASGVYLAVIESGGDRQIKKVAIVR